MKAFKRSALTSMFTTALDLGVLTTLVEIFGVNYVVATFLGTVVGFTSNFLINRQWAFEARGGRAHWQIMRSIPVQAGSSVLHTLGVWLFTEHTRLYYLSSKLIVSALVYLGWNFPMNRYFVFRPARKPSPGAPAKTSQLSA